jgi:hypothetical protein
MCEMMFAPRGSLDRATDFRIREKCGAPGIYRYNTFINTFYRNGRRGRCVRYALIASAVRGNCPEIGYSWDTGDRQNGDGFLPHDPGRLAHPGHPAADIDFRLTVRGAATRIIEFFRGIFGRLSKIRSLQLCTNINNPQSCYTYIAHLFDVGRT